MGASSWFKAAYSILWKDLLVEVRSPSRLLAAAVFSLAASIVLGYASSIPLSRPPELVLSGLLMIEVFVAVFAASSSFVREAEGGMLDGIRSSPVEPAAVFAAKTAYTLLFVESLSLLSAFFSWLFSGAQLPEAPRLALILAATGVYLSAVSAFSSAISVYVESRGVLLPMLILVLGAPMLQSAVSSLGAPASSSLLTIAAGGVLFSAAASWLSKFLLES